MGTWRRVRLGWWGLCQGCGQVERVSRVRAARPEGTSRLFGWYGSRCCAPHAYQLASLTSLRGEARSEAHPRRRYKTRMWRVR